MRHLVSFVCGICLLVVCAHGQSWPESAINPALFTPVYPNDCSPPGEATRILPLASNASVGGDVVRKIVKFSTAGGPDWYYWAAFGDLGAGVVQLTPEQAPRSECWWNTVSGLSEGDFYSVVRPDAEPASGSVPDLYQSYGVASNFMPLASPPADFLCPAPTLGESSLMLLPPGSGGAPTSWQGTQRPTIESVVDLVTGVPLIQVTDLELPFDGATFRLTRTRSERRTNFSSNDSAQAHNSGDLWWDWLGSGWMANENPVLIIDSRLPDIVGNQPTTTWLVLDANHSIPFQQIESTGQYEAPPRYRARLRHNGVGWHGGGLWDSKPTTYQISLYDGAVTYTFVAIRDDIPEKYWDRAYLASGQVDWSNVSPAGGILDASGVQAPGGTLPPPEPLSFHDRPILPQLFDASDPRRASHSPTSYRNNPGLGLPYYGICTKVEDRYGHSVEIEYCESVSKEFVPELTDTVQCVERIDDGLSKGQIKSVRLKSDGQTFWTLLYSHRRVNAWTKYEPGAGETFADTAPFNTPASTLASRMQGLGLSLSMDEFAEIADHWATNVIDRVYVFEGDLASPVMPRLQVDSRHRPYMPGAADPLADYNASAPVNEQVTEQWKHVVQYHYKVHDSTNADVEGMVADPPLLVRTQVMSDDGGQADSVFAYKDTVTDKLPWLSMVFSQNDVERLFSDIAQSNADWAREGLWTVDENGDQKVYSWSDHWSELAASVRGLDLDVHDFAHGVFPEGTLYNPDEISIGMSDLARFISGYATLRLDHGAWNPWPTSADAGSYLLESHPPSDRLFGPGYGLQALGDRLANDVTPDVVSRLSIRDESDIERHYQISRMIAAPQGVAQGFSPGATYNIFVGSLDDPQRSVLVHPYQWRAWEDHFGTIGAQPADLADLRWVAVVDEFESRESLTEFASLYEVDEAAFKPGQINRRVVEMNAAGYVLRERTWEIDASGLVATGTSGFGETFVYETVEDLFASELPPAAVSSSDYDPAACIRDDLLLTERRSVGWSTNLTESEKQTEGLIEFYDYDLLGLEYTEDEVPWCVRVQRVGRGLKRGTDGAEYFQVFDIRDPARPTSVTASLVFNEPTLKASVPAASSVQLPTIGSSGPIVQPYDVVHYVTEFYDEYNDGPFGWPADRILSSTTIGPPQLLRHSGDWYYPVDRQFYNDDGAVRWDGRGLLRDPMNPSSDIGNPLASMIWGFTEYDSEGQLSYSVADVGALASQGGQTPGQITLPSPHDDWSTSGVTPFTSPSADSTLRPESNNGAWIRVGPSEPKNWLTAYLYHDGRVSDIFHPNGRRWAQRSIVVDGDPAKTQGGGSTGVVFDPLTQTDVPEDLVPEGEKITREFTFDDVRDEGGQLVSYGRAAVRDMSMPTELESGSFYRQRWIERYQAATKKNRVVTYPGTISLDFDQTNQPVYDVAAAIQYGLDVNGRLSRSDLLEPSVDGRLLPVGSVEVNDLGQMYRTRDIHGKISRFVRSPIGQVLRRYEGTDEGADGQGWLDSVDSDPMTTGSTNLVLRERIEYGSGPSDARLPTHSWTYESNPVWAYDDVFSPVLSPDQDGTLTRTWYDWRGRPARVDVYAQGDAGGRLGTMLSIYDYRSRVIFTALYGGGGSFVADEEINSVAFDAGADAPVANDFYGQSARLLSLVEMRYGSSGAVEETRNYDIAWDSPPAPTPHELPGAIAAQFVQFGPSSMSVDPPYQLTLAYSDRTGPVFAQSPDSPVSLQMRDGVGQVYRAIELRPDAPGPATVSPDAGYQLAAMEYVHDKDGNVVQADHWVRTIPGVADELSEVNAVRTRTMSWYDVRNRQIAELRLGTGNQAGYLNNTALPERSSVPTPPTWNTAQRTVVGDTVSPTGLLRTWEYNKDDTVYQMTDAAGIVTQYEYDASGRQTRVIENAVPNGTEIWRDTTNRYVRGRLVEVIVPRRPDRHSFEADESMFAEYGAVVVDESFTPVSITPDEIGRMYTRTGTASETYGDDWWETATPHLEFKYDFMGRLVERLDARGVAFRYTYDDLSRLETITVGWYDDTTGQFSPGYEGGDLQLADGTDVPRVGFVRYLYDSLSHQMVTAVAKAADNTDPPIATTEFEYSDRLEMIGEWQALGATDWLSTPYVSYTHTYRGADPAVGEMGHSRLGAIQYPADPTTGLRTSVVMDHGAVGSPAERLGRLNGIHVFSGQSCNGVAVFDLIGDGRRIGQLLGDGILQTYREVASASAVGLPGLDAHGRIASLAYQEAGPGGLAGGAVGRMLYEERLQRDGRGNVTTRAISRLDEQTGLAEQDGNSYAYGYDALNRLLSSTRGMLVDGATPLDPRTVDPGTDAVTETWAIDAVGNYSGGEPDVDLNGDGEVDVLDLLAFLDAWYPMDPLADFNGDGTVDVVDNLEFMADWFDGNPPGATVVSHPASGSQVTISEQTHGVSLDNEIVDLTTVAQGVETVFVPEYDLAGNMVRDG